MRTSFAYVALLTATISVAGCASFDTNPSPSPARVAPETNVPPSGKFAISGGIVSWQDVPHQITLQYDDGQVFDVQQLNYGRVSPRIDTDVAVRIYDHRLTTNYQIASLDGRPVFDCELWTMRRPMVTHVGPKFLDASRTTSERVYQGCRDGKVYTSSALSPLMRVLNGDPDHDDSKVTASNVGDERLPVCNWRYRVGLEALMPAPKYVAHTRVVPPFDQHLGHIDVTGPNGSIHIYADTAGHLKKFEIDANGHSIVTSTPEGDAACDRLDKCSRAEITVDHKAATMVESLDERPIFQSRLYRSIATSAASRYYACQGGKLYITQTRASAESELKIAEQNPPAASDHKRPPIDFSGAMTTESGVVVVPDLFCDWTYRAAHDKELGTGKTTLSVTIAP